MNLIEFPQVICVTLYYNVQRSRTFNSGAHYFIVEKLNVCIGSGNKSNVRAVNTIDWIKLTNGINTPINFVKKNCITVIIHIDSWINKQLAYNLHGHRTIIITTTTAAKPHVFQTPMQFKLIGQLFSFVMVSMEEILLFVLFQILCSSSSS